MSSNLSLYNTKITRVEEERMHTGISISLLIKFPIKSLLPGSCSILLLQVAFSFCFVMNLAHSAL